MSEPLDLRAAFVAAAVGHGGLDEAEALLAAHPELAASDVHTAARFRLPNLPGPPSQVVTRLEERDLRGGA